MHLTGVFVTEEIGPVLRTAQVLGITSTAFFCGRIMLLMLPILDFLLVPELTQYLTQKAKPSHSPS